MRVKITMPRTWNKDALSANSSGWAFEIIVHVVHEVGAAAAICKAVEEKRHIVSLRLWVFFLLD
jgi:hypothetical protein